VAEQRVRNLRERAGLLSDATHRKAAEDELASRNQELGGLYRISELVLTNSDLQAVAREIVTEVAGAAGCPVVFLERFHPARECFTVVAAHGFSLPAGEEELEIGLHESLSGAAVEERRTVAVEDVRGHPRLRSQALERMNLGSMAVFPLVTSAGVWGTLSLGRTEIDPIPPRTLRWGESLANTLTSFIERVEAEEALRRGEREALGLAADLRRANEELEAFAYSVSHDLRAPLRTMQGFAHALLRDHGDALPAQGRDFVRRIIDSGRLSENLIRDLLAYSRMSFEALELQEVDLDQALAEARDQVAGDLEETAAEIRVEGPLPSVRAHHATVVQVLVNLLSNAVKFVEGGRSPLVSLRWEEGPEGRGLRLWVEDNGTGIPRDQQDRIFKVFERLQGEVERPGTGIGLAIVRRGMERVGGRVGVESEPGEGSRFWLDFPLTRPSPRRPWIQRGEGRNRG
jgi:signal transduction histidine kinase